MFDCDIIFCFLSSITRLSWQIDSVTLLHWTKLLVERKETSPDDASAGALAVWAFLQSHHRVPINPATATQLLTALSGRPDLVVEAITALHRGAFTIRAHPQHFATALRSLSASGDVGRAQEVYGLIADQSDFSLDTYVVNAMLGAYGRDVGQYWGEARAMFERAVKHGKV